MKTPRMSNPGMVDAIIVGMGEGIKDAIIPGVTTPADLLSAIFTVLKRALKEAQAHEAPEDRDMNAKEIEYVLLQFLQEFGSVGTKH